jgi:hypothetical protein
LLLMINPARPTLGEVPLADLSLRSATCHWAREDPLEAFERSCGHPRRLARRRCRQRPGSGRNCGISHHVHHALDWSKVTASPRMLRP